MTVVAVTGAGGMIGRFLVEELRSSGSTVRALLLPEEQIPPSFKDVEIHRGDIRQSGGLFSFLTGAQIVFHLAASVGRSANRKSIVELRDVNVQGTQRVFELARRLGVNRFVFLSTCCVYGLHGLDDEIVNECSPYAPLRHPYDVSKMEAEVSLRCENVATLPWTILQIPVVLGGAHTLNNPTALSLIRLARLGFIPRPVKDVTWVNYAFGRDVAAALISLARHPSSVGQAFIWNECVPIHTLVSWIADELGTRLRSVPVPRVALDAAARVSYSAFLLANRRRFASTKIEKLLQFSPIVGLEQGLRDTIRYYRATGLVP